MKLSRVRITVDDEIELLSYEEKDAEALYALTDENRRHIRAWLPWVDGTRSADDSRAFIRHSLSQQAADDGFQLGIWYRGQLVGGMGYHAIDKTNRKTEIGYWLAEAAQGKGIMTRACKALITYAFTHYHLNRVEIRCATDNRRSRAIPERLGFTQEGIIREDGWLYDHFVDHVVYGLLEQEWRQLTGAR